MYSLPVLTWIRFLAWLDIGLLIYYFYSRTHSRLAEKANRDMVFHWRDMIEFFGIFALINGFLFGIMSLLAKTGLASMKSWNEISLNPGHTLIVCIILIVAGSAMFLTGRIGKKD